MPLSRRLFLTSSIGFCGATLCGCSKSPATGRSFFSGLQGGVESDVKKGQEVKDQLLGLFGGAYDDQRLTRYVEQIGYKLAAKSELPDLPYSFTIADSPVVNAFALPGGPVVITRGLMALCNSEAELAGVLGHEIGHITARHSAERQGQSSLAQLGLAVLSVAVGSDFLSSVASLGTQAILSGYSRDQESEADALGARYMERLGYDVDKMVTFLDALHQHSVLEARMAGRDPSDADSFSMMASHPRTVDRVQDAMRIAQIRHQDNAIVNQAPYLREINGLLFGDPPEQGVIQGQTFSHPDLRITFTVPSGFVIRNGDKEVAASSQQGVKIIFDTARHTQQTMNDYIGTNWARNVQLSGMESLTINGMDAATAVTRTRVNGALYDARMIAARGGPDLVYRLLFLTPVDLSYEDSILTALRRCTYSLRRLTPSEAAAIRPLRLHTQTVQQGQTVRQLAQTFPFGSWNEDWFRLLNRLPPDAPLTAGMTVKTITETHH